MATLGAVSAPVGCSLALRPVTSGKSARPHPMVAAARANQISLFGDLNGTTELGYFTRTAVSLRRHTFSEIGGDFDADIDSTGQRLVFASTRHNLGADLYAKSVDGVAVTQLTSDPSSDIQPAFSPDDGRVAFCSNRSGNWDIWMIDTSGGPPVQITHGLEDEIHPSWSPDGTQLVFCSLPNVGGQWELWIVDARAGGAKRFIGYGLSPEWAPHGDIILYQRARERGSRLFSVWTLTLIDGEPRYPTELASSSDHAMIQPTWSPDGRRVAFVTLAPAVSDGEEGDDAASASRADVWVVGVDGRGKVRLTDGYTANFTPSFAPDGRVFFTTSRSGYENIWSVFPAVGSGGKGGDWLTRGLEMAPARPIGSVDPNAHTVSVRKRQ